MTQHQNPNGDAKVTHVAARADVYLLRDGSPERDKTTCDRLLDYIGRQEQADSELEAVRLELEQGAERYGNLLTQAGLERAQHEQAITAERSRAEEAETELSELRDAMADVRGRKLAEATTRTKQAESLAESRKLAFEECHRLLCARQGELAAANARVVRLEEAARGVLSFYGALDRGFSAQELLMLGACQVALSAAPQASTDSSPQGQKADNEHDRERDDTRPATEQRQAGDHRLGGGEVDSPRDDRRAEGGAAEPRASAGHHQARGSAALGRRIDDGGVKPIQFARQSLAKGEIAEAVEWLADHLEWLSNRVAPQASTEPRMATDAEVAEYHRGLAVEHAAAQVPTEQVERLGCGCWAGCVKDMGSHRLGCDLYKPIATSPIPQVAQASALPNATARFVRQPQPERCARCGSYSEQERFEIEPGAGDWCQSAWHDADEAQASADRPVMLSELAAALREREIYDLNAVADRLEGGK